MFQHKSREYGSEIIPNKRMRSSAPTRKRHSALADLAKSVTLENRNFPVRLLWLPPPSMTRSGMSSGEPRATGLWTAFLISSGINDARDWCLVQNEGMKVDVECYAGRKADERPVRFRLAGKKYSVEAMLDQWYEPEHIYYKVRADDGNLYILRQQTSRPDGAWDLVSFREEKRP